MNTPSTPSIVRIRELSKIYRQGLEQVLETTRLPSGRTAALETLYTTHTELELAARQSVEAAQAFEKSSRRLPGLLFASAGRSH